MIARHLLVAALFSLGLISCSSESDGPSQPIEKPSLSELGLNEDAFVEGNLYFIGYHEVGHGLVSELELPVAGREEDAVDQLATWLMTPQEGDGEPEFLLSAIHGWFQLAAETPLATIDWWGEHGTDQQRGYQVACLLYGSNKGRFGKAAEAARLPLERRMECGQEARKNDAAWTKLLEDHIRPADDVAPESAVSIRYEPTKEFAEEAAYLKDIGLLEDLSELLRTNYKIEPGIKMEAMTCDEPNAYWAPPTRTLTFCYEMVRKFQEMAEQKGEKEKT
jgi:Putative metallopeptidase